MAKQNSKQVVLTDEQQQQLAVWMQQQAILKQYKDSENAWRKYIESTFGFDLSKLKGTQHLVFEDGSKLTLVKKQTITGTNDKGETQQLLSALWDITQDAELVQGLVKWQPDYSSKFVDRLFEILPTFTEEQQTKVKALIAAAISTKPGLPELKFVPKGQEESE